MKIEDRPDLIETEFGFMLCKYSDSLIIDLNDNSIYSFHCYL